MLETSVRMLMRQVKLVVLAVVLGGLAGAATLILVPPVQNTSASVLFIPSLKQPGVEGATNPLLSHGGSVAIVATVIQIAVSDDATVERLTTAGHTALYAVVPNLTENAGPILLVTTQSTSAAQAQETRDAVVTAIAAALQKLQTDRQVPEDLRITTVTLTTSARPTPDHKKQIQLFVEAAGGTLAILVLLILLLERRRGPSSNQDAPKGVASREGTVPRSPGPPARPGAVATQPQSPGTRQSLRPTRGSPRRRQHPDDERTPCQPPRL